MTLTDTNTNTCETGCATQQTAAVKKTYMPRADVFETKDSVVLVADLPGVDEKSVDITLEKNVLTIHGKVEPSTPAGFKAAFAEYGEGDYERSFKLADEIDRNAIEASVKNGILRVTLQKAGPSLAKKIEVKAQ